MWQPAERVSPDLERLRVHLVQLVEVAQRERLVARPKVLRREGQSTPAQARLGEARREARCKARCEARRGEARDGARWQGGHAPGGRGRAASHPSRRIRQPLAARTTGAHGPSRRRRAHTAPRAQRRNGCGESRPASLCTRRAMPAAPRSGRAACNRGWQGLVYTGGAACNPRSSCMQSKDGRGLVYTGGGRVGLW